MAEGVNSGEHCGVARPAVGEENRLEGLLQFHVLAGDDVLVGKYYALPRGHKWADYTMNAIEARGKGLSEKC